MKSICFVAALMLLAGCTITKQPEVSDVNPAAGVVRLTYNEGAMQKARFDDYTTQGTVNRQCQQMGFANGTAYGQPIRTCSVFSGSLCLNEKITLQYLCHGVAFAHPTTAAW
nr:YecR family lipoprotein [uncultured Enterobacter sp.]